MTDILSYLFYLFNVVFYLSPVIALAALSTKHSLFKNIAAYVVVMLMIMIVCKVFQVIMVMFGRAIQ